MNQGNDSFIYVLGPSQYKDRTSRYMEPLYEDRGTVLFFYLEFLYW